MYQRAATALTLLVILGAPLAHADSVTAYGAGLRSCRAYLAAREGNISDQATFVDWLSGYLSAINRTSSHRNNLLGLRDLNEVLASLDNHCRARPERYFAEAADVLALGAPPGPATHAIEIRTYGSADKACQVFLDAREQKEAAYEAEFVHWLGGYLSGFNAMSLRTSNVLGDAELADAVHWLDGYCSRHPISSFGMAVDALVAAAGAAQGEGGSR